MTAEHLETVLAGDEPAFSESPSAALPEDYRGATQLLYRLRKVREQIATDEAAYTAIFEELEMAHRTHIEPLQATAAWLEEALALWHHARRKENPKLATIKLPNGTLSSSKAQPSWKYPSEAEFLEWAKLHAPGAVRPPKPGAESIDKDVARKTLDEQVEVNADGSVVFKETGEKIPGLIVRPGGTMELGFYFKVEL